MQVSFDLNDVRESANALAIVNLAWPSLIDQLTQSTAPAPELRPQAEHPKYPDPVVPELPSTPLKLVKDEQKYTQEQVNEAATTYAQQKGVPAALALLKEFGAARATELEEDKRAEFIQRTK